MSGTASQLPRSSRKPNLTLIGLRLNRGLSPNELGRLTGISPATIRLAEKGHVPHPRVMFTIAEFLEVEVLEIWPLPGSPNRAKALSR